MKTKSFTNYIQAKPNIITESCKKYWFENGLHMEYWYNKKCWEFHIEQFPYRQELINKLSEVWKDKIDDLHLINAYKASHSKYVFEFDKTIQINDDSDYLTDIMYHTKEILNNHK